MASLVMCSTIYPQNASLVSQNPPSSLSLRSSAGSADRHILHNSCQHWGPLRALCLAHSFYPLLTCDYVALHSPITIIKVPVQQPPTLYQENKGADHGLQEAAGWRTPCHQQQEDTEERSCVPHHWGTELDLASGTTAAAPSTGRLYRGWPKMPRTSQEQTCCRLRWLGGRCLSMFYSPFALVEHKCLPHYLLYVRMFKHGLCASHWFYWI